MSIENPLSLYAAFEYMVCEYYKNKEGDWQWEKIFLSHMFHVRQPEGCFAYQVRRQQGLLRAYRNTMAAAFDKNCHKC